MDYSAIIELLKPLSFRAIGEQPDGFVCEPMDSCVCRRPWIRADNALRSKHRTERLLTSANWQAVDFQAKTAPVFRKSFGNYFKARW
jgi:hypothetical protein